MQKRSRTRDKGPGITRERVMQGSRNKNLSHRLLPSPTYRKQQAASFLVGSAYAKCIVSVGRCRDLADEYRRIAALCTSAEMRSHYSGLSEQYSPLVATSICIGTQRAHSRMCDKGQEVSLQRVIKRPETRPHPTHFPYSDRQTVIHRALSFFADVSCRRAILVEARRGAPIDRVNGEFDTKGGHDAENNTARYRDPHSIARRRTVALRRRRVRGM